MARLLLTGGSGLLGRYLSLAFAEREIDAALVSRTAPADAVAGWSSVDLVDAAAVSTMWKRVQPEIVIHAAALTNVDLCERDPALADAVNRETARVLAGHAMAAGARFVQISTDSVFDGRRGGYTELDEPCPVNVYARTKLEAEAEAAAVDDHLIVRTNFFGRSPRGHGLAEWLLRELRAGNDIVGFTDVVFSPLYCRDVADLVLDLALGDARGIVHLGAANAITKFAFARLVAEVAGIESPKIRPGKLSDVGLTAQRPLDTSLDTRLAARLVGSLPTVEEGVRRMTTESSAMRPR